MFTAFCLLVFINLQTTQVVAQTSAPSPKFDPARFEAALEQYITVKACLTPSEASVFFPLYKEMRSKQKAFFGDHVLRHVDASNEEECKKAVLTHDNNEVRMKEIQSSYHKKFLEVLPASKVFQVIRAEDEFHRKLLERTAKRRARNNWDKPFK